MNFLTDCSPRLKEERKRLGAGQGAMADACGVSREMWGKYERGVAAPGSEVLMLFAQAGADIAYVLTGQRDGPAPLHLAADEHVLLEGYRNLDAGTRKRMLAFVLGGNEEVAGKTRIAIGGKVTGQVVAGDLTNQGNVSIGHKKGK